MANDQQQVENSFNAQSSPRVLISSCDASRAYLTYNDNLSVDLEAAGALWAVDKTGGEAELLADSLMTPGAVWAENGIVYWASSGGMKIQSPDAPLEEIPSALYRLSPGGTPTIWAKGAKHMDTVSFVQLLADDGFFYANAAQSGVYRTSKQGGELSKTSIYDAAMLAVGVGTLFSARNPTYDQDGMPVGPAKIVRTNTTPNSSLATVPVVGGEITRHIDLENGFFTAMTVYEDRIFFATVDVVSKGRAILSSMPVAGGQASKLATSKARITAIAIDAQSVYYLDGYGLWKVSK